MSASTGAPPRRHRRPWPVRAGAAALGLAVAGGLGAGAWWASQEGVGPRLGPAFCLAEGHDGAAHRLSTDRAQIAGVISAVALERGLLPRAATIGIATGIQESGLRSLDHGDDVGPDSRGVFQQRPSQGWGTQEQVMDPVYAAHAFFAALETLVPDYTSVPVTEAAQTVQRSAYPDAYADHEAEARAWAAALTGQRTAQLHCRLDAAQDADPEGFTAASGRQWPSLTWADDGGVLVARPGAEASAETGAADAGGADLDRAAAAWAVVNAAAYGVRRVEVDEFVWERSGNGGWVTRAEAGLDPEPVGAARVTF